MKTKTLSLIAAGVAAATLATTSALAAPSELFFSQNAGWVNPVTDADAGTNFNASAVWNFQTINATPGLPEFPAGTWGTMEWWNPSESGVRSSISITSFDSSTSNANFGATYNALSGNGDGKWEQGEFWIIDNLSQVNRALIGSYNGDVWVADTLANLRIFSAPPLTAGAPGQIFADLDSSTRISFQETPNTTCLNVAGSNPCNDIYKVLSAEFAPLSFMYGGETIYLDFTLVPGPGTVVCTSNSDPGCANAGVIPPGQIRVYTPENDPGYSDIYVAMAWRVPEPSMVALFGMGLLGLGLTARRRKAQA